MSHDYAISIWNLFVFINKQKKNRLMLVATQKWNNFYFVSILKGIFMPWFNYQFDYFRKVRLQYIGATYGFDDIEKRMTSITFYANISPSKRKLGKKLILW